jgi:hypothetical protein
MALQGEKTVYGSVLLLGKLCLLYWGLAELYRAKLDAKIGIRNDHKALFVGLLNALG